ncbi:MAG TPA: hybrid sensor histidine kinase/response regulator [Nostocaceae cyanobacterium]|nr:hybrid sensor histidine kinase/response regulator [Nostocaceae cyanobacterium]
MITDSAIREQGYAYFLAEAPDLIQIVEQELFTLKENYSIAKVHNLMRATHTIKGGAANVGLNTINMIAHSLEDIFKALYNPDVNIDSELQALLFQAYECLHLAITAELTGSNINNEELLQRATSVFAELQAKLGDAFGAETHIPTSEELGFDIVQSIFEVGVKQRLESIEETINHPPNQTEFRDFLTSQAEVLIGLAESLNLPGLGEIAHTIVTALQVNPEQVQEIAQIALADLQTSQKAVLAGDRTSGGSPSPALQVLAKTAPAANSSLATIAKSETAITNKSNSFAHQFLSLTADLYQFLISSEDGNNTPLKPGNAKFYLKTIRYIFGWFNHYNDIAETELNLDLLIPPNNSDDLVDYVTSWLNEFIGFLEEKTDSQSLKLYRQGVIYTIVLSVAKFRYFVEQNENATSLIQTFRNQIRQISKEYKNYPPVSEAEKRWLESPKLQQLLVIKEISIPVYTQNNDNLVEAIWGGENIIDASETITEEIKQDIHPVEEVENDHYLGSVTSSAVIEQAFTSHDQEIVSHEPITEDISSFNSQKIARQPSFVRVDVEGLQRLNYLTGELLIYQKRQILYDEQITELIERLTQQLDRHQTTLEQLRDLPVNGYNLAIPITQQVEAVNFDALEMDVYTELHLTLHTALEETLQLQETAESLELLMKQSAPISEKKHNLALSIIDNLVEARMLPLGTILNRFPTMMKNLGKVYTKLVDLKLTGTQVLVDKAIAEKLYDPLLQLVRNAFDHGIEPPQRRQELGKPATGLIEICAYHQGSQTIIEVRDDGQGLNLEHIRKRAIELNLIAQHDKLTESELIDFMFMPGFSTAGKVSEISGRGMGLDIVRSQLQSLNGSVSVQSSPQQGTTFILKIPFSMTTDKLMLVQSGGEVYALLQDSIEKILIPTPQQIKEFEGKKVLYWQTEQEEHIVGLSKLSDLMYYNCSLVKNQSLKHLHSQLDSGIMKNPVLIIKKNQNIFGLEVEQIIGEQELVIRPLGSAIAPPKYVYGCSGLASGNLILVIDATLLIETKEIQANLAEVIPLPSHSPTKDLSILATDVTSTPLLSPSPIPETKSTYTAQLMQKLPKVVLVVDDAISLRQTLSLTLQKSGYEVLQAQNGIEALEQLQLHPGIKIIISDLEMPRMNGFELLSQIRQNPRHGNIPVVVLTSRSAEKHRQLAHELGATAYFTKPYLEHDFLSTVNNLINSDYDGEQIQPVSGK